MPPLSSAPFSKTIVEVCNLQHRSGERLFTEIDTICRSILRRAAYLNNSLMFYLAYAFVTRWRCSPGVSGPKTPHDSRHEYGLDNLAISMLKTRLNLSGISYIVVPSCSLINNRD